MVEEAGEMEEVVLAGLKLLQEVVVRVLDEDDLAVNEDVEGLLQEEVAGMNPKRKRGHRKQLDSSYHQVYHCS